jgi:hypothetical protein
MKSTFLNSVFIGSKRFQKLNRERILENCESSLVISWLGTGVARVLRMNASEPMVGWKDEHPQSVSWLPPVIDK